MHTVLLVVILVLLLANVGVSVACLVKANKKNEPYEEGESVSELRLDGVSDSKFGDLNLLKDFGDSRNTSDTFGNIKDFGLGGAGSSNEFQIQSDMRGA